MANIPPNQTLFSLDSQESYPFLHQWLAEWSWGRVSADDYVVTMVHAEQAAAVYQLAWPSFVVHEDCVFRASDFTTDSFNDWRSSIGDLTAIQRVMNHIDVPYEFARPPDSPDATTDCYLEIGRFLRRTWELALNSAFPEWLFQVDFDEEELCLTFHRVL